MRVVYIVVGGGGWEGVNTSPSCILRSGSSFGFFLENCFRPSIWLQICSTAKSTNASIREGAKTYFATSNEGISLRATQFCSTKRSSRSELLGTDKPDITSGNQEFDAPSKIGRAFSSHPLASCVRKCG